MSHSFTYLLYHLVFATKHRRACLDDEIQPRLYAYLAELIRQKARQTSAAVGQAVPAN